MRNFCAIKAATVIGLFMVFHNYAQAADLPKSMQLTNAQLDKIAAGALVSAHGDGSAAGTSSRTESTVTAAAGLGGQSDGAVLGQVTASATSNAGPLATASSTLSLSFLSR